MSHQPFPGQPGPPPPPQYGPPSGPLPYVQQPAAPFTPAPAKGGRHTGMIGLGITLLLAGIVGGVALFLVGGSQYLDAVKDLARGPVGCTTTLDFDQTGTFVIYVETTGEVGNLRGDCSNADATYERDADDVPDVDVTLTNEDGEQLDIDNDDGKTYDADDYVGRSLGTVRIEDAGSYEFSVQSDEDEFAVAIGKDPDQAGRLAVVGVIVGIVGVVLGLLFLLLGLRRRKPSASSGGDPMMTGSYPAQPFAPVPPAPGYVPSGVAVPGPYPSPQPTYAPPPTAPLPTIPPAGPPPGQWSPPQR